MKANSDKSHLLLSTSTSSTANINGDIIKNSESEKLLWVTIDYKLNFEEHLSVKACDKASQKLNVALAGVSWYTSIIQRDIIIIMRLLLWELLQVLNLDIVHLLGFSVAGNLIIVWIEYKNVL